ncbi:MAG: ankyrin repeat domain-containing protein, partial [Aliishimia sp.]
MMYSRVTPVVLFTIFCLSVTGAYLNEGRQSLKHPAAMSEAKMQALDLYYTEMKLALQVGDNSRFEELITRQVLDMVTDDVDSFEVDVLPQPYQELRDLMLKGSVASAQAFLMAHPNLDLNAPQGRYGAMPIIWATGHMDAVPSMVKLLLAHGADPKVRSERGYNVLHAAASPFNYFAGASDAENMLKLLPAELVAGTTQMGLTPLHLALLNGQPELAISLLAHGA